MIGPIPLPLTTVAATGWTHKVTIGHADIAALGAGTTGVIQIFPGVSGVTGPTQMLVRNVAFDLETPFDFSDAGITSLTVQAGFTGGDVDALMEATELALDGTEILGFIAKATTQPLIVVAADTIDLLFTVANGGSPLLNETTVGELHVYFTAIDTKELRHV